MTFKILLEVQKYGRYLHNFPVKKMTVGYKLTGKVYSQFIQIILTSEAIKIFDGKNNLLKEIYYREIKECSEIHIAKKLQMKKGTWDYFWNDYKVIYIDDDKEETYLMFWSNFGGWQSKLHKKIFNLIHEQMKIANMKDFILRESKNYENGEIPLTKIKEEFDLDNLETYRRVETLEDSNYLFELSQKVVKVIPKQKD